MRKVTVLFFAADPLSTPPHGSSPRLLLDDEVRLIRKRVNAAVFGNLLDFDWRLAARTRDLQQALEDTRPQIVHFSGHGGSRGLVLVGADGRTPRPVDAAVLRALFEHDPGAIRLVVLTACDSLPQAEAIKEVVGCAIGARGKISDDASITFNAKFYSAIASGRSVKDAFERARTAIRLEHPEEGDILELLHRDDVDPAKIVLVSRFRRLAPVGAASATALVLSAAALIWITDPPGGGDLPVSRGVRLGNCTSTGTTLSPVSRPSGPVAAVPDPANPSVAATDLEEAKVLCRAGNYDSAFVRFKHASEEGNAEAMGFLAIAYLSGEGVAPDSQLGMVWLDRAAKKERDPHAMNTLAVIYENDENMNGRYYWARHWYGEAAKLGYAEAMRNLGRIHRKGLGILRSDSLALVWFQQAVSAGSVDAMVDIGRMHEEGIAGQRDTGQALRFYRVAADAGSPLGMYMMGRMYHERIGVRRDYAQAMAWYIRGACAGSAEAMNNLGIMYEQGLGVEVDKRVAIRWFRRAADAGSMAAVANLDRLDAKTDAPRALGWLSRPEPAIPTECESAPRNPSGSTAP